MSRATRAFKDEIRRKFEEARTRVPPERTATINVSDRVNSVVMRNVGRSESVQTAVGRQRVRIEQDGSHADEATS